MAALTPHTFHIPVMGLAFTIDSPIRIAHLGISSVVSISDDDLTERMRAFYCKKLCIPYKEITTKSVDYRAERIKAYLNLLHDVVAQKFQKFKDELVENKSTLNYYLSLLPDSSELKKGLEKWIGDGVQKKELLKKYIAEHLVAGDIDVNIMTKLDKDNFEKGKQLPIEFNDAHAALRGFAESKLHSSVVFSAGMNPRLYSYLEQFSEFYPNENGELEKKIILKVSDFRSAMIQGSFLAKKGLWVSEYRIESGLNCGGHAFATEGFLMGPILEEFKEKKEELIATSHALLVKALETKCMPIPEKALNLKITAQGGVGTAEEHNFLLNHYQLDSVGWGSPFLLVPEATSVDDETRELLANAHETDFYLSTISPLGVPFNTVKGMSNDFWKQKRINDNKAGSSCPKKFLALSKEYDPEGMCTASKKFQDIKLNELENQKDDLTELDFAKRKNAILEKACLCVGLANSSYIENNIEMKGQTQGVVICPGPNLAYFNKIMSLAEMVQHIYGKNFVQCDNLRPNMYMKELQMYIEHFKKGGEECAGSMTNLQSKKWTAFRNNLEAGILYYKELFAQKKYFKMESEMVCKQLEMYRLQLAEIAI